MGRRADRPGGPPGRVCAGACGGGARAAGDVQVRVVSGGICSGETTEARASRSMKLVHASGIALSDGTVISTTTQTRATHPRSIMAADLKSGLYVAVTAQR